MTRESDEECLALIASLRERMEGLCLDSGFRAECREIAFLLDNLEARIRESGDMAHDSHCVREIGALREEIERLRGCQDGRKDPIGRLTFGKLKSALRPLIDRDLAHNGTGWNQSLGYWMCGLFVDAINGAMGFPAETHVEEAVEEALETRDLVYCPCGTKADHERQEARNEHESAAVDALVFTNRSLELIQTCSPLSKPVQG